MHQLVTFTTSDGYHCYRAIRECLVDWNEAGMEWNGMVTGHSLGMYIWMSGSLSKWHYVTTNGIIVSQFGWMTFPLGVKNGNCSSESNIILYSPPFCWLGVNSALSFHLSCYFDEPSSEPTATRYMPSPTDVNKIGPLTIVCLKVMWIKDWWNGVQGLVPFGGLDRCAGRFCSNHLQTCSMSPCRNLGIVYECCSIKFKQH